MMCLHVFVCKKRGWENKPDSEQLSLLRAARTICHGAPRDGFPVWPGGGQAGGREAERQRSGGGRGTPPSEHREG